MGNTESEEKFCWSENVERRPTFFFKPYSFTKCNINIPMNKLSNSNRGQLKPKPRSGHRIVCDDINLYSYGGYNPKISDNDPAMQGDEDWEVYKPLFREFWKFNFASGVWCKLDCACIPSVLASNAVTLAGKVLMVFGGTGVPFGAHCSNHLYLCDLSNKSGLFFSYIPTEGNLPTPKYGQAVVLIDKYLYTIGGTTGYDYSSDIHRLDMETKAWETVYMCIGRREEPPGRYRHEVVFDGERIFVLGGGTAEVAYGFEEIAAFVLQTNQWESIRTKPDQRRGYPHARRCHSCVQFREIDNRLYAYIIGGYCKDYVLKDVWRLDLGTFEWHKLENDYPDMIYFHSSAITPSGKVYTFGGVKCDMSSPAMNRTANVYSMWVTIPKLKEICWEAILFYNPKLYLCKKSELFDYGIPREFIQRIDIDSHL